MANVHAQIAPVRSNRLAPAPDVSPEAIRGALTAEGAVVPEGERCPTCHAAIRARYCTVCGETRPSRQPDSVVGFLQEAIARLLDADNRLFRALYRLLLRPGALTVAFLNGRRRPFLGPLQLFVTINVAYFLFATGGIGPNTFHTPLHFHVSSDNFYHQSMAQRWVNERIEAPEGWSYLAARAAADSLDRAEADSSARTPVPPRASQAALDAFQSYADQFDRQAKWLSKSLVFLFIPTLTGWLWLLYPSRWRHRGLLAPLVQATHLWGGILVLTALAVIPFWIIGGVAFALGTPVPENTLLNVLVGVPFVLYITAALRHVHGDTGWRSWASAGIRALATLWVISHLLRLYRAVLFLVGSYTA